MFLPLALALSLASPAQAGAKASAFKPENRMGANTWNAQAAIDGDLETCWMVPGDSDNKGEYLILDVPKSTIDKLGMVIGWAKDETTFKDYARIKKVTVEVSSYDDSMELKIVGSSTGEFEDKDGWQVIDLDNLEIGEGGGKVKIQIDETYGGVDYPNFGISEVLLHLLEFEAAPVISGYSAEDDGHITMDLVDDNPRTFWSADAEGAFLEFEASGFGLSRIGLKAASKDYGRVKKLRVTVNSRVSEIDVADSLDTQWIELPAVVGYTGSGWGEIKMEVLEVFPGAKHPGKVGIAELDAMATMYDGL